MIKLIILITSLIFTSNILCQNNFHDAEEFCDEYKLRVLRNYKDYIVADSVQKINKFSDKKGSCFYYKEIYNKEIETPSTCSGGLLINDTLFKMYGDYQGEGDGFFGVLVYGNVFKGIVEWYYSDNSKCNDCVILNRRYRGKLSNIQMCKVVGDIGITKQSKIIRGDNFDTLVFDKKVKLNDFKINSKIILEKDYPYLAKLEVQKINNLCTNLPKDTLKNWFEFGEYKSSGTVNDFNLLYQESENSNFRKGTLVFNGKKYNIVGGKGEKRWAGLWDGELKGFIFWTSKSSLPSGNEESDFENGNYELETVEINIGGKKYKFEMTPNPRHIYYQNIDLEEPIKINKTKLDWGDYNFTTIYKGDNVELSYPVNAKTGKIGKGKLIIDYDVELSVTNIVIGDGIYGGDVWCEDFYKGQLYWGMSEIGDSNLIDYKYCEEQVIKECESNFYNVVHEENVKISNTGISMGRVQNESSVENSVDEEAEFVGGFAARSKFIAQNLEYPYIVFKNKLNGKSYVEFAIDKEGNISNITTKQGMVDCIECDKEAIRVIKLMPKWIPAKLNGKNVDSRFIIPIIFNLD